MKLNLKSTEQITNVGGVPCRVWRGTTGQGVEVIAFVHRLAVHNEANHAEFERELIEQLPPPVVVDLRQVL